MMKFTNINLDRQSQNSSKKSFGFLKWLLKTELIIIVFLMIIQLIYLVFPLHQKNSLRYLIGKNSYKRINDSFSEDLFLYSLDNNSLLSSAEKGFIKNNLSKELSDNSNYIDSTLLCKRLESLSIKYTNNMDELDGVFSSFAYDNNSIAAGKYNSINNTIYLLSGWTNEGDFESCNKEILFHELNHLISSSKESLIDNKEHLLSEVINELFTREYYIDDSLNGPLPYDSYMPYAYALCELLPKETIIEFKYSENQTVLLDELLNIDNNIDEAYLLIDSINNIHTDNPSAYSAFHDSYEYFYTKKFQKSFSENIRVLTYLCNTKVLNENEEKMLIGYYGIESTSQINEIIPKNYINGDRSKTIVTYLNKSVEI